MSYDCHNNSFTKKQKTNAYDVTSFERYFFTEVDIKIFVKF